MIFPNDRQHVDARSRSRTEHFDDFTFGINVARFPSFQTNYNFIANCSHWPVASRGTAHRAVATDIGAYINVVHEAGVIRPAGVKIPPAVERAGSRSVASSH